ncbi:TPA: DUF551 domain-containing protein [Enterobacter hormaechei subsp. xiangfangensis]|uniref:DUF551 domain-containing protein n=1 Tax=Enterobacter hormaechei TaxID=158836 RepID=UPI003B617B00
MTLTKEWLQQTIAELEEERDAVPGAVNEDAAMALAAMKLALASLEAEAVGEVVLGEYDDCGCHPNARVACIAADGQADWENFKDGTRLYTAPPAPVSVPAAMEMDDDFDSAFEHGKAVGWNAYRAAMLQSFGNSEQLNSPVIQDGWVACVERMPSAGEQVLAYRPDAPESNDPLIKMATYVGGSAHGHGFDCYCKPTHWMPLPAAPQQEA